MLLMLTLCLLGEAAHDALVLACLLYVPFGGSAPFTWASIGLILQHTWSALSVVGLLQTS